jgi:hypothetical protein
VGPGTHTSYFFRARSKQAGLVHKVCDPSAHLHGMTCWPAMGAWAFGSMRHRLSSVQPQTLQTPLVFFAIAMVPSLLHLPSKEKSPAGLLPFIKAIDQLHERGPNDEE